MEASKLTINPETLRFQKMPRDQKATLRKRNIIDYIQSKPYNTPIAMTELATVASCTVGNVSLIVRHLEKRGIITRTALGRQQTAYAVNGEPKTVTPSKPRVVAVPDHLPQAPTFGDVEALARDFAWQTNSDSLREFIAWAKVEAVDRMGAITK